MPECGLQGGGARAPRQSSTACLPLTLSLPATTATAETMPRDLQVRVCAPGFLERAPTGIAELGIVYPAASPAGRPAAEHVVAVRGDGLRAGALTPRPWLVPMGAASQAQVARLQLTDAALPEAGRIVAVLGGRGIPPIATAARTLESGRSVMTLRNQPRVEILVSRTAVQAAGISSSAAIRMTIQER